MAYLMLDFDVAPKGNTDKDKKVTSPKDSKHIQMVMIDTETGKVVEVQGDTFNMTHAERQPRWAETHAAGQVLGKDPGRSVSNAEFERVKAELDSANKKVQSLRREVEQKQKIIDGLEAEIAQMKERDFDAPTRELLAAALDVHIEELALSNNFKAYERAKKIYRRMTGKAWVEDGSADDEEGDPAGADAPPLLAGVPLAELIELWLKEQPPPPPRFEFVHLHRHSEFSRFVFNDKFSGSQGLFHFRPSAGFSTFNLGRIRELHLAEQKIERVGINLKKLRRLLNRQKKKMPTPQQRNEWRQQQRRTNRKQMPGR